MFTEMAVENGPDMLIECFGGGKKKNHITQKIVKFRIKIITGPS